MRASVRARARARVAARASGGGGRPAPPSCSLAELSGGEASVLEAVVGATWAWVARVDLALAGRDDDVASLAGRGLVECFDEPLAGVAMPAHAPQGPGVTLTPYGADLLRVELVPCTNRQGAETDRARWERVKLDPDGKPLREKKGRGAKVPRSFGSLHITEEEATNIVDGAPAPEYLVDEFNGQPVMCFAGEAEGAAEAAPSAFAADAAVLLGGLGGGRATRGVPIVRDKRLRGKK